MATPEVQRKPLILNKRSTRKLSLVQAYSRLYYKKLKSTVDARWAGYIAENPDVEKRVEELKYRNAVLKELLDAEADDVKAEVEKKREDGIFSDDEGIESDGDDAVDTFERRRQAKVVNFHRKVSLHF
jgi:hypothetical protein